MFQNLKSGFAIIFGWVPLFGILFLMTIGLIPAAFRGEFFHTIELISFLLFTALILIGFYGLSIICWGFANRQKYINECLKFGSLALFSGSIYVLAVYGAYISNDVTFAALFFYSLICPLFVTLYFYRARNAFHDITANETQQRTQIQKTNKSAFHTDDTFIDTIFESRTTSMKNNFLISTLTNTVQNPIIYAVKAACISIIPALVIASVLLTSTSLDLSEAEPSSTGFMLFFSQVIFAPVVETFVQLIVIILLLKIIKEKALIIFISAFLWAFIHALIAPLWGLTIFWSFIILSIVCLEYLKYSPTRAFIMTASVHLLQNLFIFISIAILDTL